MSFLYYSTQVPDEPIILHELEKEDPIKRSENLSYYAALYEHLEVLKWCKLKVPNASWDALVYRYASNNENVKIMNWLNENMPEVGGNR